MVMPWLKNCYEASTDLYSCGPNGCWKQRLQCTCVLFKEVALLIHVLVRHSKRKV